MGREIDRQQQASEIIIGWTQAGAIVFFAIVYAISPKAFPAGTPFEPVPWVLGIYALFTAGRLALAYRGNLSRGVVALSVVVDITVLMVTIWSFHLQYQAPPALYLKAPTLMYAFIFIALRTLRFEPAYVLLAGGCAAIGWLVLFLYAVDGPEGATFTHSYVEYVTSYQILRGAEIDKILSILVVTAVLALSLARARELLADLCRAIDELAPVSELWRVEREGRGVAAPAVGIAGAVGDIVFGTVGDVTRLEYTVIGEVVNLVAKLEKHTKNERVRALTTSSTYALALEQGYRPMQTTEIREGQKIEGVEDPIDLVVLAK
jgi:class 3 adenylate cyclase